MTVKMLIISDIHNQKITLEKILKHVNEQEEHLRYCLVAGDITNFGTIEEMEEILNLIVNHFSKTFFVMGNCDPLVNLERLNTPAIHIESNVEQIEFFKIVGFGTHKPKINVKLIKKLRKSKEKICLLTHTPPQNTNADFISLNKHGGSRELRELIDKNPNIFLIVSGHIHESPTISTINNQILVNPGSVTIGNFAIIEIQRDFQVNGKIYNLYDE